MTDHYLVHVSRATGAVNIQQHDTHAQRYAAAVVRRHAPGTKRAGDVFLSLDVTASGEPEVHVINPQNPHPARVVAMDAIEPAPRHKPYAAERKASNGGSEPRHEPRRSVPMQ